MTSPNLIERTARAVEYGCRHMAEDLAQLMRELPAPELPYQKADRDEDIKDTFFRAMGWIAAYTYGLCLMLRKDPDEAGKYYRLPAVQREMRDRALSVTRTVLQPKPTTP